MLQARRSHTATLLPSGKVLVAGGDTSETTHTSAELYDPTTGTWARTGNMALPRVYHHATLLPSGRVLVTGGNFDDPTLTELFEPLTGTWTSGGRMASDHDTATLLPWGSVLVAGGYDPDRPSAELFTLEARNQPPVAWPVEASAGEDGDMVVTLKGSDVFEDALTYTVLTQPEHGTLSGTAPHLLYTPHPDFHGVDAFTYRVGDGEYDTTPVTAALTVTPVNDPPRALPLEVTTAQQTPVEVKLEGTDVDGDTLTYAVVDPPRHGELLGTPPDLTFVPHSGYGPDSFTYRVSDGQRESELVTVTLLVTPQPGCGGCASTRTGTSAWLALLALGLFQRLARRAR
jgi:MYXO-CTERM domain-containing protein